MVGQVPLNRFNLLSDELMLEIANYLEPTSLQLLHQTDRQWQRITSDCAFWRDGALSKARRLGIDMDRAYFRTINWKLTAQLLESVEKTGRLPARLGQLAGRTVVAVTMTLTAIASCIALRTIFNGTLEATYHVIGQEFSARITLIFFVSALGGGYLAHLGAQLSRNQVSTLRAIARRFIVPTAVAGAVLPVFQYYVSFPLVKLVGGSVSESMCSAYYGSQSATCEDHRKQMARTVVAIGSASLMEMTKTNLFWVASMVCPLAVSYIVVSAPIYWRDITVRLDAASNSIGNCGLIQSFIQRIILGPRTENHGYVLRQPGSLTTL